MNLLDAKLIETQYGLEAYIDKRNNVEITTIYTSARDTSLCEIKLGISYFLLRDRNFEDKKNYFWIKWNEHTDLITLIESNIESLFAVKNEAEREATKNLIGMWLIKTDAFNYAVTQKIQNLKEDVNIQTEDDIKKRSNAIKFLKKSLQLEVEDIQNASIQQRHYTAMV